ncbi:MAG TPA: hydrogenase maturation nickel metallochaperone HypA [Acidimicrobiales bacterium]|nr:hydrogenase maturation nickel metallochaperone HypA [Acidimicrobiales bacterium]
MHELGLCEAVLAATRQRAAGRPVAGVRVRVGAFQAVDAAAFGQGFALVATGTEAEGAHLDLVVVPAQVRCRACGTETHTADPLVLCPGCGAPDLDTEGGDDLVLESLTYAPDPGAGDPSRPSPTGAGAPDAGSSGS